MALVLPHSVQPPAGHQLQRKFSRRMFLLVVASWDNQLAPLAFSAVPGQVQALALKRLRWLRQVGRGIRGMTLRACHDTYKHPRQGTSLKPSRCLQGTFVFIKAAQTWPAMPNSHHTNLQTPTNNVTEKTGSFIKRRCWTGPRMSCTSHRPLSPINVIDKRPERLRNPRNSQGNPAPAERAGDSGSGLNFTINNRPTIRSGRYYLEKLLRGAFRRHLLHPDVAEAFIHAQQGEWVLDRVDPAVVYSVLHRFSLEFPEKRLTRLTAPGMLTGQSLEYI